ncbi:hypothetical protein QBC45DRAFT_392076 [Copromyces sp. CBS 386.78]|nr:hypothetical protein QBC45DRAFT_392076 [Copromyces sp. CBS 386.78]
MDISLHEPADLGLPLLREEDDFRPITCNGEELSREEIAASNKLANSPAAAIDLPAMIKNLVDAMKNQEDILDGKEDDRSVQLVKALPNEEAKNMASKLLTGAEDVEVDEKDTQAFCGPCPSLDARLNMIHAFMKHSKAAVAKLFLDDSYLERVVNNPRFEFEIMLAKYHEKALRSYNARISRALLINHRGAIFDPQTGEIKDANGNVLGVIECPVKRKLADVVGKELANIRIVTSTRASKRKRERISEREKAAKKVKRIKEEADDDFHGFDVPGVNHTDAGGNRPTVGVPLGFQDNGLPIGFQDNGLPIGFQDNSLPIGFPAVDHPADDYM